MLRWGYHCDFAGQGIATADTVNLPRVRRPIGAQDDSIKQGWVFGQIAAADESTAAGAGSRKHTRDFSSSAHNVVTALSTHE
jgi:hypothetical protein